MEHPDYIVSTLDGMIDLRDAPLRVQKIMDEDGSFETAQVEAGLIGITMEKFLNENGDAMVIVFSHERSGIVWAAQFSGYDAENVVVLGAAVAEWSD